MRIHYFLLCYLLIGCTNIQKENAEARPSYTQPLSHFFSLFSGKTGNSTLVETSFNDIPNWKNDLHSGALESFQRSCTKLESLPNSKVLKANSISSTVADWKPVCDTANTIDPGDDFAATQFFETNFKPYKLFNKNDDIGLVTGYFEISMRGSKTKTDTYKYPIYAKPDDLITAKPGEYNIPKDGAKTRGRLVNGQLIPYYTRKEIDEGVLSGKGLEIAWVDDPVRLFFMHIQGVGSIYLDNGEILRLGFAAKSGHDYTSIGKSLIERGALTKKTMSAPNIMRWLYDNPNEAPRLMQRNKSYIFFRDTISTGPMGAQGIPLTPERSLAIDPSYVPYSTPIWLETVIETEKDPTKTYQRLLIAQDTGSAIKGPLRGDIFFGAGQYAEYAAGHLKAQGKMTLLLPKTVKVK